MSQNTEQTVLEKGLTLSDRAQAPFSLHAVNLALIKQEDTIIECRLTFEINLELYQRIDAESLFNLKPEVRGPLSHGNFRPEPEIQLEVTLQPDLLPRLLDHATTAEEAAAYLLQLSQKQTASAMNATGEFSAPLETVERSDDSSSDPAIQREELDPLLNTESWLCLSVKQQQESGETGYTTFWNHVNPSIIHHPDASSDQVAEGIVNFVKQWTEANLAAATQDATADLLTGISQVFKELVDDSLSDLDPDDTIASESMFAAVVNFFEEDDWPFAQLQEETTLSLAFRGEQGQWTCYAQVREEQSQFVFYSICPVNAPEAKRGAIAEFITRANYGMAIGNFELDFADGEIRYKTSIDVEGTNLNSALIRQLVYTNVLMMDKYLPGIMAVLERDVAPEVAIACVSPFA